MIQKIQSKHEQGQKISAISREMNVSRNTVYKYLKIKEPPSHRRHSPFDVFHPLVSGLLKKNKDSNEIENICRKEGYTGSRSTLNKIIAQERKNAPDPPQSVRRSKILSRLWKASNPDESYVSLEESWIEKQPLLTELHSLVLSFRKIFKEKDESLFERWLNTYKEKNFPAIRRFIKRILKDETAIRNAINLPWSNGVAEGHINRLKVHKAIMYGKGNFDLLRQKVLYRTGVS